jgi:hypothetical protein
MIHRLIAPALLMHQWCCVAQLRSDKKNAAIKRRFSKRYGAD